MLVEELHFFTLKKLHQPKEGRKLFALNFLLQCFSSTKCFDEIFSDRNLGIEI